jgi:hypothetical protein
MYIDGDMPAETFQERASGWQANYTDPQGLTYGRFREKLPSSRTWFGVAD